MGYHIDSLDVCFGTQLADSRGDIGVIYASGLVHVFIIFSTIEALRSPCSSLCGLNIMLMKLFDAYLRINSRILVVTLGYLIDSLDIWYGTQLADSHGDIGVIYA